MSDGKLVNIVDQTKPPATPMATAPVKTAPVAPVAPQAPVKTAPVQPPKAAAPAAKKDEKMAPKKATTKKAAAPKKDAPKKDAAPKKGKPGSPEWYKKYGWVVKDSVREPTAADKKKLTVVHGLVCDIKCVDTGELRVVNVQDAFQVKRSETAQHAHRMKMRAKKRKEAAKAKAKK